MTNNEIGDIHNEDNDDPRWMPSHPAIVARPLSDTGQIALYGSFSIK